MYNIIVSTVTMLKAGLVLSGARASASRRMTKFMALFYHKTDDWKINSLTPVIFE